FSSEPLLNTMRVGMLMTSYRRAVSGLSSTLSLPMVILPSCSLAISSSTGAIILQGPHHSAQKSTRTGVSEPLMVSSKAPSDRVRMDTVESFPSCRLLEHRRVDRDSQLTGGPGPPDSVRRRWPPCNPTRR